MNTMSIFISYLVRNINQVMNNMKDEESAKNVYGEFNQKDQRIAELEKENERLKLVEKLYQESSIGHIYEGFNRLQEENEELKQQLAEQVKTVNIERRIK